LFIATFFIFVDFYNSQTITPLYLLDVGGTEFHSGLQSTMFFLTAVILRFYFGPMADIKGNKTTLIIGTIAFTTAPLLFLFSENIWFIIAVRMYQSIGLAAYFSSASSLTSALAPKLRLGTYIGLYRFVIMAALLVGPATALKIIDLQGYKIYNVLGIILGLVALIFIFLIKEPERKENLEKKNGAASAYKMLKLVKDKELSPIYLSIFTLSIVYGFVLTFVAIYIQKETSVNPGIFFTFFGLGSVVANLVTGQISDKFGRAVVAFPCVFLLGAGTATFYFLPVFIPVLYIGSIIAGFGYAGSIAAMISWIVDIAPVNVRTTALAVQDSSIDLGIAFGSFIFGLLVYVIGLPYSFAFSGILLILFACWKIFNISRVVSVGSK